MRRRFPRPLTRFSRRRSTAILWGLVPLLILLVVWQQTSVDRLVVHLDKAKDVHRSLESQVNALALEANRLSSLEQVEDRARGELGLGRPGTEDIVDLVFGEQNLGDYRLGTLMGAVSPANGKRVAR
jgi:cell division protein FtsL